MCTFERLFFHPRINSVLCISQLMVLVKFAAAQGGTALELQRMNENLMNKKCPLEVCQSVCMVKNASTGCFTCSPYCNTGSGGSMMSPNIQGNMLGNFNPGGYLAEYSGCKPPCKYRYNSLGTMMCSCQDQRSTSTPGRFHDQGHGEAIATSTLTAVSSRTITLPTSTNKISLQHAAITSTKPLSKETTTTERTYTSSTKTTSTNSHTPAGIGQTLQKINLNNQENSAKTTSVKTLLVTSTESGLQFGHYQSVNTNEETPENKTNIIIIFVLTTLLFVTITICIVFIVAWRRTARELHRNRNELYFVNKTIRQDSCSSRTAILPEPVYAHIGGTPEVPPRGSPLTSCSSSTPSEQFLMRTVSLSSETPLKETVVGESEDRHDYLQLI